MGTQLPLKGAQLPLFIPCPLWQTAGWIKMPLGTKIGLVPIHIVLHGDPAPPKRGTSATFRPISIVTCGYIYCGWMGQDATWYKCRPQPRPRCVRWGPSSAAPSKRGTAPNFRPLSIVAKRSPVSATAEHLLKLNNKLHAYVHHLIQ